MTKLSIAMGRKLTAQTYNNKKYVFLKKILSFSLTTRANLWTTHGT